jgi:hypothetical protein
MTTNSVLMCRNSSFVCVLHHPLLRKRKCTYWVGSGRRVQWWWIVLFVTHSLGGSYPPYHLATSSYSLYSVFFLLSIRWWTWVQKPANPKYNVQYVIPEHRAVMEPLSHRKPVFTGNLLHFFPAVILANFRQDSSKCQPIASQQSTQILEIVLGTVELLSWKY